MTDPESRKETRLQVTATVRVKINPAMQGEIHLEKEAVEVQLTDISSHGVGFLTQTFLPKGVLVDLEFPAAALRAPAGKPPTGEATVRITGRIVYARPQGDLCRIGLDITEIDEAGRRLIQQYVSSRESRRAPRAPLP